MPTDSYDRDLIAPLEAQGDWDAKVERELDDLQAMPLYELQDMLSQSQMESLNEHVKEYLIETFGAEIATDRIHGREGR